MILYWDENATFRETSEGLDTDGFVHSMHFSDGFPLCWDQGRTGAFAGSPTVAEVTCKSCITYLGD